MLEAPLHSQRPSPRSVRVPIGDPTLPSSIVPHLCSPSFPGLPSARNAKYSSLAGPAPPSSPHPGLLAPWLSVLHHPTLRSASHTSWAMPASGPLHTPCLACSPALPVATGASHLVPAHVWLPQRPSPPACFYFSTLFLFLHPRHITASDLAGSLTTSFLPCNLGQLPNGTVSGLLTCHQVILSPPCHAAVRARLRVCAGPRNSHLIMRPPHLSG